MIADGPPGRLVRRLALGPHELILLEPVEVELVRVPGSKLGWTADRLAASRRLLHDAASEVVPSPSRRPPQVSGDPDDDLILATALSADADVLVSGDRRHLLPLGEHEGMRIVTSQALLAELRTPEGR